jgi:hypothetical protein
MIETTQPHVSSKALLESLAARDQETEIRGIQPAATPNTFENWREPGLAQGKQSTQTLLLLRAPSNPSYRHERSLGCLFAKTIMPVEN